MKAPPPSKLAYVWATALVSATTVIAYPLSRVLGLEDLVMVYLLAIMLVAVRFHRGPAFLAAALSVAAFDFFFVPPAYTFAVKDPRHLLTFGVMFAVGLVISSLTVSLRREREAALRAKSEEMRSALLSAVSHDLRTPLAAITGAATMLRDDESRIGDEQRRELVVSICDEAAHLERFLANLLDMTRIEGGVEVKKEWVPLEEVVGSALTRLEPTLGERRVDVRIPDEASLVAIDPVLFGQVFVNVLENASKYTPAESPLEIVASARGGGVEIEMLDRGPGLQDVRLFEKFVRGHHVGVGGVGLGLAISRGIVEAHGGTITGENREGGGARFAIFLPHPGAVPTISGEAAT